jgi:hypothetical protein
VDAYTCQDHVRALAEDGHVLIYSPVEQRAKAVMSHEQLQEKKVMLASQYKEACDALQQ